jgi:1-acyl-sn-glycerol-3-phosphate acyltransferase
MDIDVEIRGLQNLPWRGSAIIAPNHQSGFDILVLAALPIDFKWVAKEEVGRIPFVGWAVKSMGTFFVKRDKSGHDLNVMKEVEEGLKKGKNVIIFPEGTRTRTGELLPFKKGAFRTAQNTGIPLCPVAIQGTYEIVPPGQIPSHRGHQVTVRVGEPFSIPPGADLGQAMEEYRKVLMRLLEEGPLRREPVGF